MANGFVPPNGFAPQQQQFAPQQPQAAAQQPQAAAPPQAAGLPVIALDGVKAQPESMDLPGTGGKMPAQYLVELTAERPELYTPNTENGRYVGRTLRVMVRVIEAGVGSQGRVGSEYAIRLKGFGLIDNQDPTKAADYRFKQQLRALLAACSGYSQEQLDQAPGAWSQLQTGFSMGSLAGRRMHVLALDRTSKDSNPYIKYKFAALPAG